VIPLRFSLACLCVLGLTAGLTHAAPAVEHPNIVLIFTDDQGYGDVGCYGARGFKTPHLDQMAREGLRFTDFYVGCPVCSGSRTALLTGCHYRRLSVPAVMFPRNRNGLNPKEITIAEVLKPLGYHTGIIGKWHLGHLPPFLPTRQGFDYYYGIPYSNDMTLDPKNARFARDALFREGMTLEKATTEKVTRNWVPLMRGEEVIEYPADQRTLTKRYTEEAVAYINKHKDGPFFLYLPHTMPHLPMAVSKEFKGRTRTLFGDVMEEIDWSVGEVLKAIKECGIDDRTLVLFTTDNGTRSGSSGPLRGRKASVYEGGIRVPCIVRWPGQVPAGAVCSEVAATIDVLPTLAKITGGKVPSDRIIDGKDISPLLFGKEGVRSPHDYYILAHGGGAVRSGQWKYYPRSPGQRGKQPPPGGPKVELYDLSRDLSETTNVADKHPEVVKRLHAAYQAHLEDLKKNRRPAGQVPAGKK
jgi:arylsulfatase A